MSQEFFSRSYDMIENVCLLHSEGRKLLYLEYKLPRKDPSVYDNNFVFKKVPCTCLPSGFLYVIIYFLWLLLIIKYALSGIPSIFFQQFVLHTNDALTTPLFGRGRTHAKA